LHECQKILSIKFKKTQKESINYLTIEGIKLLLQQTRHNDLERKTRLNTPFLNV